MVIEISINKSLHVTNWTLLGLPNAVRARAVYPLLQYYRVYPSLTCTYDDDYDELAAMADYININNRPNVALSTVSDSQRHKQSTK